MDIVLEVTWVDATDGSNRKVYLGWSGEASEQKNTMEVSHFISILSISLSLLFHLASSSPSSLFERFFRPSSSLSPSVIFVVGLSFGFTSSSLFIDEFTLFF